MTNAKLLRSKMVLFGDRQEDLARAIGLSLSRLNAKINSTGGAEFKLTEIHAIKIRYQLTNEELVNIFFEDSISPIPE